MWATFGIIAFALFVCGKSEAAGVFTALGILAFIVAAVAVAFI